MLLLTPGFSFAIFMKTVRGYGLLVWFEVPTERL